MKNRKSHSSEIALTLAEEEGDTENSIVEIILHDSLDM